MLIGVPTEIKQDEHRVGLTPTSVRELTVHGHQVLVQSKAGAGIGVRDTDYERAGATIVPSARDVFAKAEMVVKVKEPHFKVFPEFVGASYMRRYEIFCRKLVLERHYTVAAFISSTIEEGLQGSFSTPAADLSVEHFAKTLTAHLAAFA